MTQSVFTFVTKVNPERVQDLESVLHEIAGNLTNHPDLPFTALAQLHFASLVIFYDDHYGPYLVFENNVDGTPEAHLEQLCRIASKGLHRIYAHCLGYDRKVQKTAMESAPICRSISCVRTRITSGIPAGVLKRFARNQRYAMVSKFTWMNWSTLPQAHHPPA